VGKDGGVITNSQNIDHIPWAFLERLRTLAEALVR